MTTEMRGQARMAAYHAQRPTNTGPSRRQLEDQALGWARNDHLEALLAMSDERREQSLAKAGASARISLHFYRAGKAACEQVEALNQ